MQGAGLIVSSTRWRWRDLSIPPHSTSIVHAEMAVIIPRYSVGIGSDQAPSPAGKGVYLGSPSRSKEVPYVRIGPSTASRCSSAVLRPLYSRLTASSVPISLLTRPAGRVQPPHTPEVRPIRPSSIGNDPAAHSGRSFILLL
ncbi:hypothetical protein NDU88_004119 [Pleurodeles waltl]|uniref:Uncharacterized protein n=1 Tax=Pleurodeles waltl TaxID=8319 RepID=A0AAV7LH69_PLEWA|nr:hypothetical protein NDU88_004119 [Pleurodeles waltl]